MALLDEASIGCDVIDRGLFVEVVEYEGYKLNGIIGAAFDEDESFCGTNSKGGV